MRRFILAFAFFAAVCYGQTTTPNLGLILPATNSTNWGVITNYNMGKLDAAYGAGQIPYQGIWSSTRTYSNGVLVSYLGILYASTINGNIGNNPVSSGAWIGFGGGSMVFPPAGLGASTGSAWRTPVFGDVTTLFGGGSCAGSLQGDGTCSTSIVKTINGNSGAFTFTGAGVSCSGSGTTWTCTFTGGTGSGTVSSGSGYALVAYGSAASTTVGPTTGLSTDASGNDLNVPGFLAPYTARLGLSGVSRPLMGTWLQCLANAANQVCHLALIGDSYMVEDQVNSGTGPATQANLYADMLRQFLQYFFGYGGTGIRPVRVSQGAPLNINTDDYPSTAGTLGVDGNNFGPGGGGATNQLIQMASGSSVTFAPGSGSTQLKYDTLYVYCMTNSSSGVINVSIDGGAHTGTACGTTTGSNTAIVASISAGSLAVHSAVLTSSGTSHLYAVEGTAGSTGVRVSNMGWGGATAQWWWNSGNGLVFSDLEPAGTQGALIMLQTNEINNGFTPASFATNMQSIITHEQGLTGTPSLLLAVPPVSSASGSFTAAQYTAQQYGLQAANPIDLVNIQWEWGLTLNAGSGLWSSGNLHPNTRGAASEYAQIIPKLFESLPTSPASTSATVFPGSGTGIPFYLTPSSSRAATATDLASLGYVIDSGTTNAYAATLAYPITSYTPGLTVSIKPASNNTSTTPTLAVSGLSAVTIVKGSAALAANDIVSGVLATFKYDGTNFELQNPQTVTAGSVTMQGTAPITIDGDNAPHTGTSHVAACPTCSVGSGTSVSLPGTSALGSLAINGEVPLNCSDTSGSGTVQFCTTSPSFTPSSGNCVTYQTTTANSGTGLTLNVNSLGAKSVEVASSSGWTATLTASASIPAGKPMKMCYDGTFWNAFGTGFAPAGGSSGNHTNAGGLVTWSTGSGTGAYSGTTGKWTQATDGGPVLISGIPGGHSDIILTISTWFGTTGHVQLNFSGDSGSNYWSSDCTANNAAAIFGYLGENESNGLSTRAAIVATIPNYTGSSIGWTTTGSHWQGSFIAPCAAAGIWSGSDVTSIQIGASAGTIKAGSTIEIEFVN